MTIAENFKKIRTALGPTIHIVLATKGRSPNEINSALSAGALIIGENYVQEAFKKKPFLLGEPEIHLIGHLQRNKVKRALEVFDAIQSVDSFSLAEEINKHAAQPFPILLQANIGEEKQKFGCDPKDALALARKIGTLPHVRVIGLMAMAPYSKDAEDSRPYFVRMKELFESIKKEKIPGVEMKILSMGMSADYRIAVDEGSTMVRIGEAIFGKRSLKK